MSVSFDGLDLNDDSALEALEALPDMEWLSQGGLVRCSAKVAPAQNLMAAVDWLVSSVVDVVPTARPHRVDRELVSISDVSERVGVSREAVRHWANGTRGCGGFPSPVGIVSNGTRIFEWSEVETWLRANLELGDGEARPSVEDAARADLLIAQWRRRLDGIETHRHWTEGSYSRQEAVVSLFEFGTSKASSDRLAPAQVLTRDRLSVAG